MRSHSHYTNEHSEIRIHLDLIANRNTSVEDYRNAMTALGQGLGHWMQDRIPPQTKTLLACTSEDADWLAQGILQGIIPTKPSLAVFWNHRTMPFGIPQLTVAPIQKTYIEDQADIHTLIICKSIIYTSCVVRTNLYRLFETLEPEQILIAAPVMFEGAEITLRNEFPTHLSDKFEFFYFAMDTEVNEKHEVIPGVGGSVYQRLGIGDAKAQARFVPEIVKTRRALHPPSPPHHNHPLPYHPSPTPHLHHITPSPKPRQIQRPLAPLHHPISKPPPKYIIQPYIRPPCTPKPQMQHITHRMRPHPHQQLHFSFHPHRIVKGQIISIQRTSCLPQKLVTPLARHQRQDQRIRQHPRSIHHRHHILRPSIHRVIKHLSRDPHSIPPLRTRIPTGEEGRHPATVSIHRIVLKPSTESRRPVHKRLPRD